MGTSSSSWHGQVTADVTQVGDVFTVSFHLPLPIDGTSVALSVQGVGLSMIRAGLIERQSADAGQAFAIYLTTENILPFARQYPVEDITVAEIDLPADTVARAARIILQHRGKTKTLKERG